MDGAVITRISFSFYVGEVVMMVKRTTKKGDKEIAWIKQVNCRACLRYLWGSYSTKRRYIEWKPDTYEH